MEITWIEFFMFSLASFRLTRLIVFDKITEFLRAPFLQEEVIVNEDGEKEVYYVPKKGVIRNFIGELISCTWCTGIWASAALYLCYLFYPAFAAPVIVILAIAGSAQVVETAVQLLSGE
ncbi:MAG: DUF1360 domain-containing protein [Bacillales bacterium]